MEKTQEGEMPEVDVDVEEGEMPEYDVDWVNVDVKTRTKTITVPKVVVVTKEKEVEVPVVDVYMPDDSLENVERTIKVEAEVTEEMHELEIEELYATENYLYVISTLEPTGEALEDNVVRVSDQVVLNAPEDLVVRHYIIGEQPNRAFNEDYRYVATRDEVDNKLTKGRTLYSR